jgi:hypothetical protein
MNVSAYFRDFLQGKTSKLYNKAAIDSEFSCNFLIFLHLLHFHYFFLYLMHIFVFRSTQNPIFQPLVLFKLHFNFYLKSKEITFFK